MAHRVALALADSTYDGTLDVLHCCDNRWCVAAAHLRAGTHAQNLGEMALRGRSSRGEKRWSAKLTDAAVLEIRRLRAKGIRVDVLASRYGVTPQTIHRAVTGRHWKHLDGGAQ